MVLVPRLGIASFTSRPIVHGFLPHPPRGDLTGQWVSHTGKKKQRPETTSLKLARWNIRTMQDSDKADQPQGCSALVEEELAWLDIHIAALCRVRFAKQGSIKEHGAGYTLYWSDISREDHRLSREGFILKNTLASKLTSLPLGHSDHLKPFHLTLQGNQFTTIISVYAPTLIADPATKEAFYINLRSLLWKVDSGDKLIITGNFNTRVGQDYTVWPRVLGCHGFGYCNANECMLLELCAEQGLQADVDYKDWQMLAPDRVKWRSNTQLSSWRTP